MDMDIVKQPHHCQQTLCSSRPCYRQGKKLTAVKVYTVSDESRHLLISQVPAIKLHAELCVLCNRFGDITTCSIVPKYEDDDKFVETYHVQYSRIQSSRFAKKQLDGRSFYGGVLHVCYAPELETANETRDKLVQRRKEVASRIKNKCNSEKPVYDKRSDTFRKSNDSSILLEQTETPYECTMNYYESPVTHEIQSSSVHLKEAVISNSDPLPEQQTTSQPKPLVPNSTLKFIPRSVKVSKRIVFHKKQKH